MRNVLRPKAEGGDGGALVVGEPLVVGQRELAQISLIKPMCGRRHGGTKGSTGARRPRARNAEADGHVRRRVDGRLGGLMWLGCLTWLGGGLKRLGCPRRAAYRAKHLTRGRGKLRVFPVLAHMLAEIVVEEVPA